MDIALMLTVVQVSIFGFGLAEYDIKTVNVEVPWSESRQGCTDIGYDVLNLAVVPKTELVSQGVLKEGEYYWTSQYQSKSPFYWKFGCYDVTDRNSLNETDFGRTNSVFQCSQKCGGLQFFGLENTTCFCFPASAKLSQESKTPCTTVCPGNSNEICGESGSAKMTVYRKLDESEDRVTLQDTTGDCVTLNKEDLDQLYNGGDYYDEHESFTNQLCTEKKTFFCRNYKHNASDYNSEIFLYKAQNMTWYEAQRYCISSGNDMAYIDGSNALGVLTKDLIPEGSESWVGLFRATAELSITTDDVTGNPTSCHSITVNGNILEESYNLCMHKRKTVCMKEIPTTEARTSEMSSTDTITEEYTTAIPSTEVPTSETPTTEIPTTETPTTELPTTETHTTELPTTETHTTEVPTTELPATEPPTTEMPTTQTLTTETLLVVLTEETTETTPVVQTTNSSKAVLPGSGDFHDGTSPKSTEVTTKLPQPHVANVAQKNVGEKEDNGTGIKHSGLLFILIALVVILIVAIILVAMAYKRYRRNRSYQKVSLMMIKPYTKTGNGAIADYSQTPPSPAKTPTPKKPARTSMKQDNVLLNISQGNFVSQSDQFVPGTRDDVSWNLPFIDASRETLDNMDDTQPVVVRRTILLSENEANNLNIGHPNASVDLDDKVSHTHSEEETDALVSEPILNTDEDDDIFDDNVESRLPRSPSEHIDLLFRMSLSGEKD
ncbi:uncharacterized protein LOC117319881 [Pecten maximus]|uniref:uncharacterized protein LOC117319881 n=1 Tax=Pecten maximus TaxID=6579 RepID=UPI001458089C|nr:uncharacterized protein LOC117319881 [Pecten maximus]XP_033730496.1 uncharacterized protein LOC117319881 [Pecten maximus]XP_033730500.1 uncharacterized protein LOC117319881 [Pecten maximus]XP_033730506.1 uncharacterized protein LOC117319881 [Pecten maximus]XP_033730513.1 uncharacterized protein LOC117319881 [Pecten maximus]